VKALYEHYNCVIKLCYQTVLSNCVIKLCYQTVIKLCYQTVLSDCVIRLCYQTVLSDCVIKLCYQTVLSDCVIRLCYQTVLSNCVAKLCYQTVLSNCVIKPGLYLSWLKISALLKWGGNSFICLYLMRKTNTATGKLQTYNVTIKFLSKELQYEYKGSHFLFSHRTCTDMNNFSC
jgi:hypothetical protein